MGEAKSHESEAASRRNNFVRQCRDWANSLDNAILRLNFKSKRGGGSGEEKRATCCERCGASGRVRFSIQTRTTKRSNAKVVSKFDRRKRRKAHKKNLCGKRELLGRCEVCSHVMETHEMPERDRSSYSIGDNPVEERVEVSNAKSDATDAKTKKKKKKRRIGKEEFAGLNLSKKSSSLSSSAVRPLKSGDKKLLEMLRKNSAAANGGGDRLSAFLRK